MRRLAINIALAFAGLVFWQCSETKEVDPEMLGGEYFPLQTGMYQVYQVHGTRYLSYQDSATFTYLLREVVTDSFQNLESGLSYKILRQKKMTETDLWVTDSVWTARKNNGQAIRVENNLPIVSLIFPLGENKKWDGNKLNAREEDEYEMMDIGRSFTQGSNDFQETVTVVQEDLPDIFVESKYKIEVYGKGQGLVYKEINLVNYRQGDDYGLQKVESGLRYFQTLIEYGKD